MTPSQHEMDTVKSYETAVVTFAPNIKAVLLLPSNFTVSITKIEFDCEKGIFQFKVSVYGPGHKEGNESND